ncbi:MAG: Integral membrane protein TerC family protein [Syntrophus sp. PtaU1.Bin208]|nr:MAG: Integral membrane protein TerC family protein [Syntrophus sp. PtaU1.Bin208]
MDLQTIFHIEWNLAFFLAMLNIVCIDLILSGDNAVLIAMAVRGLPKDQRKKGILLGTSVAVALRVTLTFMVAFLLVLPVIKLVGGILILWIATKLFMESEPEEAGRSVTTIGQAIKVIIIADVTMSLDNVLAVAGAAQESLFLLLFGLALSIPLVIFTSNLLSTLMDKYPVILLLGAAILGRVGGDMIMTDPLMEEWLHPTKIAEYGVQLFCAVGVIAAGKLWMRMKISRAEQSRETPPSRS